MTDDPGARPQPAFVIGPNDECLPAVFLDLMYRTGALHRRIRKWPVDHRSLPRLPKLIASAEYLPSGCGAVGEIDRVLVFLELAGGNVTCRLASQDPDRLDAAEL